MRTMSLVMTSLLLLGACAERSGESLVEPAGMESSRDRVVAAGAARLTDGDMIRLLLKGATGFRITAEYQPRNVHAGVDVGSGREGDVVYAPVSGQVIASTTDCGRVVILDQTGYSTVLLHMKAIVPKVGAQVRQGDAVGQVSRVSGSGCSASVPHLHVEVRRGWQTREAIPTADNSTTTLDPRNHFQLPNAPPTLSAVKYTRTGETHKVAVKFYDPEGRPATLRRIEYQYSYVSNIVHSGAADMTLMGGTPTTRDYEWSQRIKTTRFRYALVFSDGQHTVRYPASGYVQAQ